jgi:hypothetical protein
MRRIVFICALFCLFALAFDMSAQERQNKINRDDISDEPTRIMSDAIYNASLDSLPGVFVIGTDDAFKECADSFAVLTGATTTPYTGEGWVGTHFLSTGHVRMLWGNLGSGYDTSGTRYVSPDTVARGNTSRLSMWDCQRFYNAGWEMGLHNRMLSDEGSSVMIWDYLTGVYGAGDTTFAGYEANISRSVADLRMLGFPAPRSYSYARGSGAPFMFRILKNNGIECATSTTNLPHNGWDLRYNFPESVPIIRAGKDGWTQYKLSAVHGDLPHKYEIPHMIGPGDSLESAKEKLMHAVEFGGMCLFLFHYPSELNGGFLTEFLVFADSLRNDGRLINMTFNDAYKWYYQRGPSEVCNLLPGNFEDVDSAQAFDDNFRDMMVSISDSFTVEADGWMSENGVQHKALLLGAGHGEVDQGAAITANQLAWRRPSGKPGEKYIVHVWVQYDSTRHSWSAGDSCGILFRHYVSNRPNTKGAGWGGNMIGGGAPSDGTWSVMRGQSAGNATGGTADQSVQIPRTANTTQGLWFPVRASYTAGEYDVVEIVFWWDTAFGAKELRVSSPWMVKYDKYGR